MSTRMIKGNVERIAATEADKERLEKDGFKAITDESTDSESDPAASEKPLEDMTVTELKALAKNKDIKGADSLNKEELLAVLKDVV